MIKRQVSYVDFNGNDRTDTLYFNLTKAELLELELSTEGGYSEAMDAIVATKSVPKIFVEFKKIVLMSYGQKAADGAGFDKDPIMAQRFTSTEAYSQFFMELVETEGALTVFFNDLMPAGMEEAAAAKRLNETKPEGMSLAEHQSRSGLQGHNPAKPGSRREAREQEGNAQQ